MKYLPLTVYDPLNQKLIYQLGGNNQPLIGNIGEALRYKKLVFEGEDTLRANYFSEGMENYLLVHLYCVDRSKFKLVYNKKVAFYKHLGINRKVYHN